MRTVAVLLAIATIFVIQPSLAGMPDCCTRCGCQCQVKKVCRLVCETKKVTEVQYDCRCEDFCTPGPSQLCGERPVCDCDSPCGHKCEKVWQPSCGCVRTRNVLVKHEVSKEVPSYKCVVEYVCERCCGECGCTPEPEVVRQPWYFGIFRK